MANHHLWWQIIFRKKKMFLICSVETVLSPTLLSLLLSDTFICQKEYRWNPPQCEVTSPLACLSPQSPSIEHPKSFDRQEIQWKSLAFLKEKRSAMRIVNALWTYLLSWNPSFLSHHHLHPMCWHEWTSPALAPSPPHVASSPSHLSWRKICSSSPN